jgi:uncharacterized protein (TIRG00374 family)
VNGWAGSTRKRQLLLGGLLATALLVLAFRGVDRAALLGALRGAHPLPLLGLVLVTVVGYLMRSWRWQYLLAPLGKVPVSRLFAVTMIGFTSGFVIPRAGEVLRPYLVSRSHGIPTTAGLATIILERLIDLVTVLVLFGVYLFLLPPPAAQKTGAIMETLRAAGAITGLGALAVLAVLFAFHVHADRAMGVLDRLFRRLPVRLGAPLSQGLRAFGAGLAVLQAPLPHLLAILGQSLLLWLSIALGFFLNHAAFGIDLPFHATFLLIAFLVVGVAIPTPGMVGGFHAFYILALSGVYGITQDVAAAAGLVAHALSNLPVVALGLFFLGREGLNLGKVAEMAKGHAGEAGRQA